MAVALSELHHADAAALDAPKLDLSPAEETTTAAAGDGNGPVGGTEGAKERVDNGASAKEASDAACPPTAAAGQLSSMTAAAPQAREEEEEERAEEAAGGSSGGAPEATGSGGGNGDEDVTAADAGDTGAALMEVDDEAEEEAAEEKAAAEAAAEEKERDESGEQQQEEQQQQEEDGFDCEAAEATLEVLSEAFRQARKVPPPSNELQPVAGADGWMLKYKPRMSRSNGVAGDVYLTTPTGKTLDSLRKVARWLGLLREEADSPAVGGRGGAPTPPPNPPPWAPRGPISAQIQTKNKNEIILQKT